MKVTTFEEMAIDGLRDIYNAEQQIVKALPKMQEAATAPLLKNAFGEHEGQTREQIARLEKIFTKMGESPAGKVCEATRGLIKEAEELISEIERGPLLDAALIGAAQKVEHYEMAAYGTARTFAERLGDSEAQTLLQTTLDEEGDTDKKLTQIAMSSVNAKAAQE